MRTSHERFPVVLHYAAPARYAKGGLVDAALAVKNAGRYGDTELIHVNKAELAELKQMWGEPTINPQTGQPEFFLGFLKKLLPIAAMFIPGIGPAIGGALKIGSTAGSALLGAGMGAMNGGVKGALLGGLTGGVGASGASDLAKTAVNTAAGAATGGVNGALGGALGSVAQNAAAPSTPASTSSSSTPSTTMNTTQQVPPPTTKPNFWNKDFLGIKGIPNKYALPALAIAGSALFGGKGNQDDPPPDQAAQDKFFNPVFRDSGRQPTSGFQNLGARSQDDGGISNSRTFQAYNAGRLPERANFNYVQGGYAKGGEVSEHGGESVSPFAVRGAGSGREDKIPAVLSDGEYVFDAETVAMLGDGSTKAGAQKLDALRVNLRKHKGRNLAKGKISLNAKSPEKYLKGGRA